MSPDEFVVALRSNVIEDNLDAYRKVLEETAEEISDPYWKQVVVLWQSLPESMRPTLLAIMRQVTIDTLSTVFGILDGHVPLDRYREEFSLRYGKQKKALNGDLQDLLLAMEEEEAEDA